MKLRELLDMMDVVRKKIGTSPCFICGGTPRDRFMGRLDNVADLDITTGDKSVDYLSQEFEIELRKKYNVTRTTATDGHSTIRLGSFKMDFSSNFNVPGIDDILHKKGIPQPTSMQKEMFSRDFTCNALLLAFDLKNVVDPTHQGFKDIKERVIRTCLDPQLTLTSNKNRVIRAIYLATKLDFNIDPAIISFVQKNPQAVQISTNKVMVEKLNEAFKRDPEKASYLITQMGLWNYIPIPELVQPYYMQQSKSLSMTQKKAYFQGGDGINEPTPGKVKYKVEKSITVQPRFVEPFYRNYDLYMAEGVDGPPVHTPGVGWHNMHNYNSIQEYLTETRKLLKGKYVAEDTWITEENHKDRENRMKLRAEVLHRLIKEADRKSDSEGDDNEDYMMPPKEHGTSIYNWKNSPYQGKPKAPKRHDHNSLDFPIDDQVTPIIGDSESYSSPIQLGPSAPDDMAISPNQDNLGNYESYPAGAQLGGLLDKYLPQNDFEGKSPTELDFGRDYTDDDVPRDESDKMDELEEKYLNPAPTHGLYGLPDGADLPDEDLGDPTDLNPDYGTYGPESLMYEDKWNI